MYQTKTKHILNFIVIGGSIGGLSTAYCIRQAGHNITLLEKHDISVFQSQKDSGLRIPPNMTRLLNEFPGAKEMLEEKATISPGHFLVEGSVRMAKMTYKEEVISDLGALYYRVPYLDLWNYLYGLCISCNVQCKFNSEVADIIISAPDLLGVRTVLTTGENINGDIIIGADGHNSIVRDFIITDEAVEGPEDEPEQTDLLEVPQLISCRLSIPLKEMEKDPELQSLTENNWWTVWMGYGQFHNAGKEGNEQYGLNIYYPFKQYEVVDMDWNIRKPCLGLDELEATEYGSQLRKLLSMTSSCHRVVQKNYKLNRFIDNTLQLTIVGDAAHAALMNGVHNAAVAIEDAYALGFLFSKVMHKYQIPLFLKGYGEIRRNRTKMIRESEIGLLNVLTLFPGSARDSRNEVFRKTLDDEDDEYNDIYSHIMSDYLIQCNYDSKDAIEEWWHNWGRLM